jgi:hypothetical protein
MLRATLQPSEETVVDFGSLAATDGVPADFQDYRAIAPSKAIQLGPIDSKLIQ